MFLTAIITVVVFYTVFFVSASKWNKAVAAQQH